VNTDEPFGPPPHIVHLRDRSATLKEAHDVGTDARKEIAQLRRHTAQTAESGEQLDACQRPDHGFGIVRHDALHRGRRRLLND
jgi:hypothetical protein